MFESQSRFYKYVPPTRRITSGEIPNQFFDSDVLILNSDEMTNNPDQVDFLYATSVPRNPQAVDSTIEQYPSPGLTTRDYLRKDYRFSPLRTTAQPKNTSGVAYLPMRVNKNMENVAESWPGSNLGPVSIGRSPGSGGSFVNQRVRIAK